MTGIPYDESIVVQQIDLAPTLATLFGLSIPMNNLGILIPQVFQDASTVDLVRLYQQNAEQLWRILQMNLPDSAKGEHFIISQANLQIVMGVHTRALSYADGCVFPLVLIPIAAVSVRFPPAVKLAVSVAVNCT